MNKKLFIFTICVLISGCSDIQKDEKIYKEYVEGCTGKVITELHVGTWGREFVVICEDYGSEIH